MRNSSNMTTLRWTGVFDVIPCLRSPRNSRICLPLSDRVGSARPHPHEYGSEIVGCGEADLARRLIITDIGRLAQKGARQHGFVAEILAIERQGIACIHRPP